jgi:hypothetical protein
MKASIAHDIKPSALILGKDSRKRWGREDIVLAKAYQRFLGELCQQCGLPKYICHSDDERIQFKPSVDECNSSARAEREQADLAKQEGYKGYGRKVFGEPYLVKAAVDAGMEFSDFRRPYLKAEADKRALASDA